MGRGDALHALQGLDAALGLAGLGGLGAEALDEALDAADLLLLADKGGLALAQAFGAQGLEGAVVAGVKIQLTLLDVGDLADDGVQEVAVVGDQQEGAGIVAQPGLQPDDRVEIQVVGGFVEEHEVGAAHEGARQAQAHAPAPGPARHRAALLAGVEAQAVEQAGGAALGGIAADGLQAGVEFALAQAVPRRLRLHQLALNLPQLAIAVHDQLDGGLVAAGGLLGDVGDLPARGDQDLAGVRVQLALDEGEEARLAAAVGPDQTHLLTGIDAQVRGFEEEAGAPA